MLGLFGEEGRRTLSLWSLSLSKGRVEDEGLG